jgi:hypothetical protein
MCAGTGEEKGRRDEEWFKRGGREGKVLCFLRMVVI